MRRLQDVLATDYGLADQLNGWNLWQAWAISDDGMTIVGAGTNPAGQGEVWVATISAPSVTLIGDANGDGVVDNADFAVVVANYGMTSGATVAQGDFDGNARVNLRDVLLVKTHFGERLSAASRAPLAAAIPEPASWLVALLAAIVIVAFRIAAWLRLRATVTLAVALITFFAAGSARANGYSFTPLGFLPAADFSIARGISADGSVIVGWSSSASGTEEAFRWTNAGGMVGLGNLPGGTFGSFASGVSTNGSVIVGSSPSSGTPREAFRWTSGGGMVGLGDLPGGDFYSGAIGVSSDGSVIVGLSESASSAPFEAFRWTNAGGMVGLGDLPGGVFFSVANAVSADGSVIVGNSISTLGDEAFRWTIAGGMVGLGDLPGGIFRSQANDVSADGSVVVGWSSSTSGTEAYRWTNNDGMVGLGRLPGSTTSFAYGISADGSVVVGQSNSAAGSEAFYWTATDGMVSLRSLLAAGGVSGLTEWSGLFAARDVSADGRTIVGIGTNPAGQNEAWVATIGDSPVLIGDANGDDVVNHADLAIVTANYGTTSGATVDQGDFDANGSVNLYDLLVLKHHYGETLPAALAAPHAAAVVPEPVSWVLALLGAAMLVAFRIAVWPRLRATVALAVALITFFAAGSARANGYSFTPLGDLPGGDVRSVAYGISADGSVIVGSSASASGGEAFRWTNAGGMVGLGDLPGGTFGSNASDVSADGSVIVGWSSSASGSEAFRWTNAGGMVGLGDLPGGTFGSSFATDVSADGSVIVGNGVSASGNEAFRWTSTAGMVGLGDLPGGSFFSAAWAASANGSVIVGHTSSYQAPDPGINEAFRWTIAGGMVGLGDLPGGIFRSTAYGVSADGSVVVGWSTSTSGTEAYRWTNNDGMVGLGRLPGSTGSSARGVSADGSVVVGASGEAFYWTAAGGMVSLRSLLAAAGVPGVTGWTGLFPLGVSADGRTIVGWGYGPAGGQEAWVATIGDSPVLIGDANGDGVVDNSDLAIVVSNYGTTIGATVAQGDFDGNARVNLRDVLLVKTHFGDRLSAASRAPLAAAIPEPASWLLALLAAIMIVAFRIAAWLRLHAPVTLAVALITFFAAGSARANGYSFTPLGDLPGGSTNSRAYGISADGSVIVGSASSASGGEAFRWTNAGGMVGLGDLPGGTFSSTAYGVSADGSVIVGFSSSASSTPDVEAFRWTISSGMVGLGDLPGANFSSSAGGVSADGSTIVGSGSSAAGREAFRWTSAAGMVGLGDLPGGVFFSVANAVSADGSVIVGTSSSTLSSSGWADAFRWTSAGGMVGLGDLPGGIFRSTALGVSADGSVIVGNSTSASGMEAFRWTSGSGMVGLGDLPGGTFSSTAYGVSADGSVVVGASGEGASGEAFYWTATDGMVSLRSLLGAAGVPGVTGWIGLSPQDVSADGRTIVGWAHNQAGQVEAFVATIGDSPVLIGDANGDRIVDNADLATIVANYGMTSGATVAQGDLDGNGRVNLRDVLVVKSHFGETLSAAPPAAAIPEPATWISALVALIAAGTRLLSRDRGKGDHPSRRPY